jgi:hypothetical protein
MGFTGLMGLSQQVPVSSVTTFSSHLGQMASWFLTRSKETLNNEGKKKKKIGHKTKIQEKI